MVDVNLLLKAYKLIYKKKLTYEVDAEWDKNTGGEVKAGEYKISFDTPKEFKGNGKAPCPDQLFLASISSCLMNTFISFKNRFGVESRNLAVHTSMSVELENPKGYRITCINSTLTITCEESQMTMNKKCAELARDYCHITRSIKSTIYMNIDIVIINAR